jgi:8-oxo-dGTP pyrophosphatase MutT (NUDIX family)
MSDYIKELRKLVGHRNLIICGASVLLENYWGEVLLQLRTDNNTWCSCGGAVELGETVEETAARELFEETGLIADELELFKVFSGKELHYIYPNGDEVSVVDIVFICRKYHGDLKADPKEVKELRFFSLDEIPENISPPVKGVIKAYIEMRKGLHK